MAKPQKLGKGLNAIFGDEIDDFIKDLEQDENKVSNELKIEDIRSNPYQPRKTFDEEKIKELAESIKEHGVLQPIIVRKSLDGYELIAGERRLKASKVAEKETIPAIVVDFNDQQMMEVALLENVQREDLSPIEEAEAYDNILKKLNYTQDELAKRVGKSRPYITNMLRLLKLPREIREMLMKKELSYGHARALVNIEDEEEAIRLAQKAVKDGLSVREIENLSSKQKVVKPHKEKKAKSEFSDVEGIMERKLATKVKINKHQITISYSGIDDLNRILELIDCLDK